MFKLRPYQERAMMDIIDFLENSPKRAALVVQPTGAGKSLLVANIAKYSETPIVIIQPSKELLIQNFEKYRSYGLEAAVFSASFNSRKIGHVTFATIGSIVKYSADFKARGVKNLVIDEAHYGSGHSNQINTFAQEVGIKKIIGLTATPVLLKNTMSGTVLRMLNRSRDSFWQEIIHVTQIKEMTENGFWSKLDYQIMHLDESLLRFNSTGTDFTDASLKKFYEANDLNEKIKNRTEYLINSGCRSILIFAALVAEAKYLQTIIPNSIAIYGDMPSSERDFGIKKFKSGDIKVAINVNVLGTGFDYPQLDAIIHGRPTGSVNLYYQHIGRLVRIHPDKEKGIICDLSGNCERFGKVEDFEFKNDEVYGWGMFSNDRILTDYNLKEAKKRQEKPKEVPQEKVDPCDFKMPFGKHEGKKLSDIDKHYLTWLASDKFEANSTNAKVAKKNVLQFLTPKLEQVND